MVCLKSQLDSYKEALSGYDGIDRILGSIWTVNRINMKKPIRIRPLGSFFENGINDVGVDVALAVGHRHEHKVRSFFWNRCVNL